MSIELKIYTNENEKFNTIPSVIKSLKDFKLWWDKYLAKETDDYQCVIDGYIQGDVMDYLNELSGVTARDGISGGCYGARNGSTYRGLTVYIDAVLFPERWLDGEDEYVNIAVLLDEYATELEGLDADSFLDACEALGHEIKHDNTYNYLGHNSEDPIAFQGVDFKCVQTEPGEYGCKVVVVRFHCGGDIRGNYSSEKVYKFNDAEDFYTVFNPMVYLKEEN